MFYFYQRPVRTLIVSTNIQTQCIQLPDGSKVTLNRHSQLAAKVAQRPTEDGDRALVDSFLAEVGEQA